MSIQLDSRARALRWLAIVLASTTAVHAIGCGSGGVDGGDSDSTVSSSRFDTDELDAGIYVSASAPGRVFVGASLEYDSVFDVEPVELDGGDSFRATLDGRNRTLERSETSTEPYYVTSFDQSPAEGSVRVRFRGSNFTVTLRPEFTVTSPTAGQVLGFQDDLDLQWTPAEPGGVMQIWIRRECRTTTGGVRGGSFYIQVLDTGAYTFDLSLLPEATDPAVDTSQDCSLELDFRRHAYATISPPFSLGSDMQSTQRRTVQDMSITF
jgi:hypothetical protein